MLSPLPFLCVAFITSPPSASFQTFKEVVPRSTGSSLWAMSPDGTALMGSWAEGKQVRNFLWRTGRPLTTFQLPSPATQFSVGALGPKGAYAVGALVDAQGP